MSAVQIVSEKYMNLVRRFPLIPIRNKSHLHLAAKIVDELSDRLEDLYIDERQYFDVLCDLIKHYESSIYSRAKLTPSEALKFLMKENKLKLTDLTPIVRHKSHLSAFLNDKRGLSKANAVRLANHFKVSPALFLPAET